MLKAISAFLLLFAILSVIVQAGKLGDLFALSAVGVYAIDFALTYAARNARQSTRMRETIL
jgi:hypothetical protein